MHECQKLVAGELRIFLIQTDDAASMVSVLTGPEFGCELGRPEISLAQKAQPAA